MECKLGVKFSALWTSACSTTTCRNLGGGTNTGRNLACGTNTGRNFAYGTDRLRKERSFAFILVLILQSDHLSTCLHLVILVTTAALGGDSLEKIIHHFFSQGPEPSDHAMQHRLVVQTDQTFDTLHMDDELKKSTFGVFNHCRSKCTLMMLSNVCSPALVCFWFCFLLDICVDLFGTCVIQHYKIMSIHYVNSEDVLQITQFLQAAVKLRG